jgi:phosphatidylinositol phospholipase C delta
VDVFGVPSDCTTHATQIIRNNGFHPLWNELLPPYKILCPDLAILLFRVFDKDGIMIAQKCFPFNCIQSGYRMVALRDKDGSVIGATSLFVHIAIS